MDNSIWVMKAEAADREAAHGMVQEAGARAGAKAEGEGEAENHAIKGPTKSQNASG